MTDQFTMYDAAYLLGALTPQDRADFEAHLATCQECRTAVNQLAGMPGLLASVAPEHKQASIDDTPLLPDTLLPRLLAEVQRTRFRRRWTTVLIGTAAAAVLAIALVFGLSDSSPLGNQDDNGSSDAAVPMTPVSTKVPIHATARLSEKAWGTEITIWCQYDGVIAGHENERYNYTLYVIDKAGASQQVAAWAAKAGEPVEVEGSSSVPTSEIASVQVRGPTEVPILWLKP